MFRRLSVQPGLRGSNDLRVGRKMAVFQLFFFQSGRAKDLSAPRLKPVQWNSFDSILTHFATFEKLVQGIFTLAEKLGSSFSVAAA